MSATCGCAPSPSPYSLTADPPAATSPPVLAVEALDVLVRLYPRGVGVSDPEARVVFNSLMARDSGLVELVEYPDSPSGDAYVLSDEGADAFREEAEEAAQNAAMN